MIDIQWNTGAQYTREGQIIRALVRGDEIIFTDFSRGITGTMNLPKLAPHRAMVIDDEHHFKEWVHGKYLRNDYQPTGEWLKRKA